jgi:uridine phosphorylase
MIKKIQESELILNADGSIYHLALKPDQLAHRIILVGDPQRVDLVSALFDEIEHRVHKREFITHTGFYKGARISVVGTGIGTDNIDIVMNELDALVNIDLQTRQLRPQHTRLHLVRIGTSGALQGDIPVDTFIASEWGLGLDSLLYFYALSPDVLDEGLSLAIQAQTHWNARAGEAYAVKASAVLLEMLAKNFFKGITLTAPGFYGPQGRMLRLEPATPDFIDQLTMFEYQGKRISNFEMETSALYGLARLLGHEALTICVAIANRQTGAFSKAYQGPILSLSRHVLDGLAALPA